MLRESVIRLAALLAAVLALCAGGLARASQPAAACERAAVAVAAESGVPADILGALTLTETGRRAGGVVRPWAWSVNAEGTGSWFDDPGPALAFAQDRLAKGRRNLDIGCFQLNYRWHGANFASVSDMFDPVQNARYAARFLTQLYAETGDWRAAAGAFHSRRPADANRYLARFDQLRAGLRAQGWGNLTGTAETYNDFAAAGQRRVAGAGAGVAPGQRGAPAAMAADAAGEVLASASASASAEIGGAMPDDMLPLGVEAPVPDVTAGGAQDIALGGDVGAGDGGADGGRRRNDGRGGDGPRQPSPRRGQIEAVAAAWVNQPPGADAGGPGGGIPATADPFGGDAALAAGGAMASGGWPPGQGGAAPPGEWLPQPLPGEELTMAQLAADLTGQPTEPSTRRHRTSHAGITLLGAAAGAGQAGAPGSLAVLADARTPLLQAGGPLLARTQP